MQRDMDLCREILLKVEAKHTGSSSVIRIQNSDPKEQERVDYHTQILTDAGLLTAQRGFSGGWDINGLTWEGHDFIEATRQSQTWEQTKSATAKVGGWTFGLLKDVAVGIIKAKLKANGVDIT